MSYTHSAWPGTIHFVIAMRTRADIVFGDELRQLGERFPNLHVHVTLSRPDPDWTGASGFISPTLLRDAVPELRPALFSCADPT